jgi:hypothetical protein
MPPRGPDAVTAEFLRDALAGGPLGVPKLDWFILGSMSS